MIYLILWLVIPTESDRKSTTEKNVEMWQAMQKDFIKAFGLGSGEKKK